MFILLGLAIVSSILILRYRFVKRKYQVPLGSWETGDIPDIPGFDTFVHRLGEMIRIPTISWTDLSLRQDHEFSRFQDLLVELYPRVHGAMSWERLGHLGLIYHWKGKHPHKKPVLFLAHYDVVPAQERGGEKWDEPPFEGCVKDGVLWGRGSLDIKTQIAFQLETAERLLEQGWAPDRDIYFAYGGDEEIAGREGAGKIAALFKERGLEFEFVLDEGGVIAKDQLAFLKGRPAALVGLAEKGFVTYKITARGESGHSSMPLNRGKTAMGDLARAIAKLEARPFPSRMVPVLQNMLERFVPHVSLPLGIVFSNLWLFSPLIRWIFSKKRTTDSLIRTTQAVTVARCGDQENILPGEAFCLINHRILPGDTREKVASRHGRRLAKLNLSIEDAGNWPSNDPITEGSTHGSGFKLIQKVLGKTHPGVLTVPFLVTGATDSKYYGDLTKQILRFTPLETRPEDLATIHGVNERVGLDNLKKGLAFYHELFLSLEEIP